MSKKVMFVIAGCAMFMVVLFTISVLIAKALLGGDTDGKLVDRQGIGLVEVKGMILDSKETIR